jgi:hypothetical protein
LRKRHAAERPSGGGGGRAPAASLESRSSHSAKVFFAPRIAKLRRQRGGVENAVLSRSLENGVLTERECAGGASIFRALGRPFGAVGSRE